MRAIILLSGGVDSTVTLALAKSKGYKLFALSFDYNQKHAIELKRAQQIANFYQIPLKKISLDPELFTSSSLVKHSQVPEKKCENNIPSTYVPARNTLFIAYAIAFAEYQRAETIFIGANKQDLDGYPDCRPDYFHAMNKLASLATKQAVTGNPPTIATPLINMEKKEVLELGHTLKTPLEMTWSCYDPKPGPAPCGVCNACRLIINLPFSPLKTKK